MHHFPKDFISAIIFSVKFCKALVPIFWTPWVQKGHIGDMGKSPKLTHCPQRLQPLWHMYITGKGTVQRASLET